MIQRLGGICALLSLLNMAGVEAVAQDATPSPATAQISAKEFAELKAELQAQQKQIEMLRLAVRDQEKLLERYSQSASSAQPAAKPDVYSLPQAAKLGEIASTTPMIPVATAAPALSQGAGGEKTAASPLFFNIGTATFTPLGFIDVTSVFRSTNTGAGIGSGFGSIPYSNGTPGQTTENRLSLQNSRLGLRVDSKVLGGDALGYLETDFLGNAPANLLVTSNSNTLRMRLFWFDYHKDKFEFLGGQTWSLLTPNRKGLSALPSDLFYSQNIDTNYQAGLSWTRAPEFRFLYHANDSVTAAVALENPEQYIGTAVTFAAALPAGFAGQFSTGASNANSPNLHPDIIGKVAFDGKTDGKTAHLEFGGVFRTFQAYDSATSHRSSSTGGGGEVNGNVELVKGFRLVGTSFFGSGVGRYINGLVPDLVTKADGTISTVDTASAIGGFELSRKPADNPKNMETLFYGYYGGVYVRNNFAADSKGKLYGYGFPGSSSAANRAIQEITLGFTQTLWKNPAYGDLKFMTQYSYLTRDPWSVAAGTPTNARAHMVFVNLRYDLP